jgi:ribosomal protein S18 acetylase RimI-like enzyme
MRNKPILPASLRLREFQFPNDYPLVYQLWQHAGQGIHLRKSDELEEIKKKVERDPDLFLIAEIDGQIVGSVIGGFDGRRGMVYHLAVEQSLRHKGLGRLLMSELEKRMAQKGCLRSYLLVTRDNLEAIHLYESTGWESMDLLIFGKDLA